MSNTDTETRIEELEDRIDRLEEIVVDVELQTASPSFDQIEMDVPIEATTTDSRQTPIRRETRSTIREFEQSYGESAPVDYVVETLTGQGYDPEEIHDAIDHLRRRGSIYEPKSGFVKVV